MPEDRSIHTRISYHRSSGEMSSTRLSVTSESGGGTHQVLSLDFCEALAAAIKDSHQPSRKWAAIIEAKKILRDLDGAVPAEIRRWIGHVIKDYPSDMELARGLSAALAAEKADAGSSDGSDST